jgi:hypothetical protein
MGTPAPCGAAVIEGTLLPETVSGVALHEPNGKIRVVVWPHGYALRTDVQPAVVDANGDVAAVLGEPVALGGGEQADGKWWACP